jgi:hypothetical protein
MTDFRTEPHTMTRVDISTGMPFAAFDPGPMQRIVDTGGTWDDVRAEVAKNAPNELMRYGQIDATANAAFTMDKPSAAFGSLGIAEVTVVGEGLDRKVVNLLRIVGVDAEQALA